MAQDFITKQSAEADLYLFRAAFHGSPDAHAVNIMRQLIPALKPGSRMVISDSILLEPNTGSLLNERLIR